jgi:hypothetical protein
MSPSFGVTDVRFIVLAFLFTFHTLLAFAETSEKKSQLEDLLIWKLSDDLKLNSVEEKKFTELYRSLSQQKANLNHEMQDSIERMSKATTSKSKESELQKYRKTLLAFNHISEEEFDKMKALLGVDKTVQYLQIKQDLTNRIKTMLANPNKDTKPLPSPKVIEE